MLEVVDHLDLVTQRELLDLCRGIVKEAPLFRNVMPNGAPFRFRGTCAGPYGWISDKKGGYRYDELHPLTGKAFPPIPEMVGEIVRSVLEPLDLTMNLESMLLNWYEPGDKLGLHRDDTEESDAPVVSISLGDDAVFSVGGKERRDSVKSFRLRSGDVLVMAHESRYRYHGVRRIVERTAPALLGMNTPGRMNLTIRQVRNTGR